MGSPIASAGSAEGAQRMAVIYYLVAACKLDEIITHEYSRGILPKAGSYPSLKIADLTRINWKLSKNGYP